MAKTDVTYAYGASITKAERDPETGDLLVYGKATGPDLDLDEQICDPTWLKSAMPRWFEWGNVREMHGPVAAGIGVELAEDGDDWNLLSRCVDPGAADKIEKGVYKGYSIGIKNARTVKDVKARGGRIVGGEIVEISYVDRPCNPTAKMSIAKGVGLTEDGAAIEEAEPGEPVELQPVEAPAPAEESEEAAEVVPDAPKSTEPADPTPETAPAEPAVKTTSFVIAKAVGIDVAKRARRLLGELSKGTPAEDIASAEDAIKAIGQLVVSEAEGLAKGQLTEAADIECLLRAVDALSWFIACERAEGSADDSGVTVAVMELAAGADAGKAAPVLGPEDKKDNTDVRDAVKAAVAEATTAYEERLKALDAELAKVRAQPVSGGPVLARPRATIAEAGERETAQRTAEYYKKMASELQFSSPDVAAEYQRKAAELLSTVSP